MFEDIRQQLSKVPEGEVIEESMEERPVVPRWEPFTFLQRLTPSQRLFLLGLLLIDLFLFGFLVFLVTGVIRLG